MLSQYLTLKLPPNKYLEYGKVLRWLREDPIPWSFFFFFCNHVFIVSRYTKPHVVLVIESTKPINPNIFPPTSPRHVKNQTPRIHTQNPPDIAPKILIPQTGEEPNHRNEQERDPNPSAGPHVTLRKESRKPLDRTTIANMPNPRTRTEKARSGRRLNCWELREGGTPSAFRLCQGRSAVP